jgi:hypothetical protein
MGAEIWKMNASLPEGTHWLGVTLEEHLRNGESKTLERGGQRVDSAKTGPVLVGLVPAGPGKMNVLLSAFGGSNYSRDVDDILVSDMGGSSSAFSPPLKVSDGEFALMAIYHHSSPSGADDAEKVKNADVSLILKITPQAAP